MSTTAPTAPAAWNGNHTRTVALPSGNVAELRERLPVYLMLRTGQFSQEMFEAFNDWQAGVLTDPKLAADLVDLMVTTMFLNPKVTRDGADGTVPIDAVSDEDIDTVLEMAAGGQPGGSFPDDAAGGNGGANGQDVAGDAVEPDRPRPGKSGGAKRRQSARKKPAGG